jgi:Domain of unknown function (DUF4440)
MKNFIAILAILVSITGSTQVEETSDLYLQMKKLDSIVFDLGFNNCDLKSLETVLAEDLEFYHDVGGTQDKAAFLDAMAKNICGNPSVKITRELVSGSLQVFPLNSNDTLYGAFVRGAHEFYQQKTNEGKHKTGYAKFTSYWEFQNGAWKLKRAFSFDHKAT